MVRIFRHYMPFSLLLAGVVEGFVFFASVPLARYINRYDSNEIVFLDYTPLIFTLVVIFSMAAAGLYSRHLRENFQLVMFRIVIVLIIVFFLMSFLFYLHPALFTARTSFVYALLITGSILFISRTLLYLTIEQDCFKRRVIVFGAGKKASHLNDLKRKSDKRNIILMGFLAIEGEEVYIDKNQLINASDGLFDYVEKNNIEEVIVAIDDRRKMFPVDDVLECKLNGIAVLDISTFFERQTGRIKLDALHPSNLIFSDGFVQRRIDQFLKPCYR